MNTRERSAGAWVPYAVARGMEMMVMPSMLAPGAGGGLRAGKRMFE